MKRNHVSEQADGGHRRGILGVPLAPCQSTLKDKMPAPALSFKKGRMKNMAASEGGYEYPDYD